jgi:hypothetical protein
MRNEKTPLDARLREFKFRGNLVNPILKLK